MATRCAPYRCGHVEVALLLQQNAEEPGVLLTASGLTPACIKDQPVDQLEVVGAFRNPETARSV